MMDTRVKDVAQLDEDGFFLHMTVAHECQIEEGVFLMPAGTIDVPAPTVPQGMRAKWADGWTFEVAPIESDEQAEESEPKELNYAERRRAEYPPITEYIDAIVKGDKLQLEAYILACLAVKEAHPKTVDESPDSIRPA